MNMHTKISAYSPIQLKLKRASSGRRILLGVITAFLALNIYIGIAAVVKPAVAQASSPLSFVIGVPGRTGCLVCHGDPKIMAVNNEKRSLYVNANDIFASAHKDIACTSCHTDFNLLTATQNHGAVTGDFRKVAGLSCKNCHQHVDQLKSYAQSVHGRMALSGDPKGGATCADCHGSHTIKSFKKDAAYRQSYQMAGQEVCGKCHKDYADSYNDYYHGRAYKAKALDAPACWDCHGAHEIMPAKDPTSLVSSKRLAKACGKCHADSREPFAKEFGPMIHGSGKMLQANLVMGYVNQFLSLFDSVFQTINSQYRQVASSLFYRE